MCWRNVMLCAMLVVGGPAVFVSAAEDLSGELKRLLKLGTSTGPLSKEAQTRYASLRKQAPDDWRIPYAYALLHLQQRRFPEAREQLDLAVQLDDRDLQLRCAMVWVQLLGRDFEAALESTAWVAELLGNDPALDQGDVSKAIEMLGSTYGFLEGPVAADTSSQKVWEQKVTVLKAIGSKNAPQFDGARTAVLEKFEELELEADRLQETAEEAKQDAREQAKVEIEHAKDTAANERLVIKDKAQLLEKELKELPKIEEQLAALRAERQQLDLQAALLNAEAEKIESRIEEANRDRAINRIDRRLLEGRIRELNLRLFRLNELATFIIGESERLTARREALLTRARLEGSKLQQKLTAVNDYRKRALSAEKQLKKPTKSVNPAARAVEARLDNVSTYLSFPLEEEQVRVIGLVQK